MSESVIQHPSSGVPSCGANGLATLLGRFFVRRKPPADRLPDHLLRDAGLERIGGVTRRRLR